MTQLFVKHTIREQVAAERFAKQTDRSLSDARLAQLRDRQQFTRETGAQFDPFKDGHLLHPRRPR